MGVNLLQAYVLGDQSRDVQLACRIGAKSLLVRTGLTSRQAVADCTALQFYSNNIAVSLTEATECIFSDLPGIRQSSSFGHWCETRDLAEELIPDGDYPVGLL